MIRQIDLEQISDGKRYHANDMVKADCQDCRGCSACCRGMGSSIVLDPYDVFRLSCGLGCSAAKLLQERLELNVVDGVILPNLKMAGEGESCTFLNSEGRCSVHPYRPGFCRLFPLGRLYEEGDFSYFLQIHECRNENRTKVKVKKWVDTPDFARYEGFIREWHYFLKDVGERLTALGAERQEEAKKVCLYLLNRFYLTPYDPNEDFYRQIETRLNEVRSAL